jgi:hypothetical protein
MVSASDGLKTPLRSHVTQRVKEELSSEQAARFSKGVAVRFAMGAEKGKGPSERGTTPYDQSLILIP